MDDREGAFGGHRLECGCWEGIFGGHRLECGCQEGTFGGHQLELELSSLCSSSESLGSKHQPIGTGGKQKKERDNLKRFSFCIFLSLVGNYALAIDGRTEYINIFSCRT